MKPRVYLCEGKTEQRLIDALKKKSLVKPGKTEVFNASKDDIKKMLRKWGGQSHEIFLVVDADTGPYQENSKLATNIKKLKNRATTFLILQCHNLEDELARSCGISQTQLFSRFNASSSKNFKGKFIATSLDNLIERLYSSGFDIEQLWQFPCDNTMLSHTLHKYLRWPYP